MPGQMNEHLNLKYYFHKEMKLYKDTFMKLLKKNLVTSQFSQGIKMHLLLPQKIKPVHDTSVWLVG